MQNSELMSALDALDKNYHIGINEVARRTGLNASNLAQARLGNRSQVPFLPKVQALLSELQTQPQEVVQAQNTSILAQFIQSLRTIKTIRRELDTAVREAMAYLKLSPSVAKYLPDDAIIKMAFDKQQREIARYTALASQLQVQRQLSAPRLSAPQKLLPAPRVQAEALQQNSQPEDEIKRWERQTGMVWRSWSNR